VGLASARKGEQGIASRPFDIHFFISESHDYREKSAIAPDGSDVLAFRTVDGKWTPPSPF
jgi:hypothetical protein